MTGEKVASIKLQHVSVLFPIYDASSRSLKRRLFSGATGGRIESKGSSGKATVIRALDALTLNIEHGDRVGLIGHNGAGKTTMLRLLAGIYEPSEGQVEVHGSIAPLFDISLGMDREATGYENILLRGLFLGMSRREIKSRMEDIAEFTELGEFLDLPLRTYSSGMRTRLAFAVSTSFEPEILLLDEGIGAGDASFIEKARKRLREFTDSAGIIVLASHSDSLIRRMCKSALLLEHGSVVRFGPVDEVLEYYHETHDG